MDDDSFLIVGLGNPGDKYTKTRHNIGFLVVDEFAEKNRCQINHERWDALSSRTALFGRKVYLIKPQTFMNLSGKAVARFVDFYKIPVQNLLVIQDDLDMKLGRVKLTRGGGHGGHNGIRSLIQYLGERDFFRLKIGIGRPGRDMVHPDIPVENYVLTKFSSDEVAIIAQRMSLLVEGIGVVLKGDIDGAMNLLNSLK